MPTRFIKQSRKRFVSFLSLIVCILVLSGCNGNRGFSLQKFEVKNTQLDSIVRSFVDSIEKIESSSNGIPIMTIHHLDSIPAFYFTVDEKESITPMYIFSNNRRIVGYINTKNKDIIVLTSINSKFDFEMEFYKFLIPTDHLKSFDFIYFPDDMYCVADENGLPCPPILFDPNYKVFIYKNNKFEMDSIYSDYFY